VLIGAKILIGGVMEQKFIFRGRLPSLNEVTAINRKNKYEAARLKKFYTEQVAWEATIQHIKKFDNKVLIEITYYEPDNRRDDDNVQSGAKFILDGLKEAGVIKDDRRKYVSLRQNEVKIDKLNPRIEILIKEIEE